MFSLEKLKTLFSNHASPGGAIVIHHPFSFCLGGKHEVRATASDQAKFLIEVLRDVEAIASMMENDNFAMAVKAVDTLGSKLESEVGQQ
jgi:hypothetical protein